MSDFLALQEYVVESISRPIKYIIYRLMEFIRVVDKFVFRPVPTGAASGYANIEKVEGNTVKFNQLSPFTTSRWSIRNTGGTAVFDAEGYLTLTNLAISTTGNCVGISNPFTPNHICYIKLDYVVGDLDTLNRAISVGWSDSPFYYNGHINVITALNGSALSGSLAAIHTVHATWNYFIIMPRAITNTTTLKYRVNIYDLTAIFGEGNEPTTVADFEAWLAQNIGTLPYYDYNAGELLSVKMSGMQTNTSKLPLGYQELEYIESSGTQCINTGIKYDGNDFTLEWKAIDKGPNLSTLFAATNYEPYSGGLYANTAGIRKFYVGSQAAGGVDLGYTYDSTTLHSWRLTVLNTDASLYKDGVLIGSATVPNNVDTQHVIYLFCGGKASNNNLVQFSKLCLYNWKLTKSGVLAFNGIPAKRLSDNVLGMYDTVSNTFFTNSGTGTFIGGPEVHLDTLPFDVTTITGINTATNVRETIFPQGMKQADRAGTVKDELDLLSDTATVRCGYYEISGSESWEAVSSYPGVYRIPSRTPSNVASMSGDSIGKCSHYELCPTRAGVSSIITNGQFGWNQSYYLHIKDERFLDATTFKAYLASQYAAGTPVTIIYSITPITYTDLQDANGNPIKGRYAVENGGTEQILPVNTSTPTTVAPTIMTVYMMKQN